MPYSIAKFVFIRVVLVFPHWFGDFLTIIVQYQLYNKFNFTVEIETAITSLIGLSIPDFLII